MKKIKFRDLKRGKNFISDKYKFTSKKIKYKSGKTRMIYFALAIAPSGTKTSRIVSKDFYKKYK